MRIADYIHIQRRFLRSAHLERDFRDPSALDGYVVTPQIQESLDRIAAGLDNKSGQRAWRITGDYGSGKSSFALLLAHVLATGGRESALPPTLRKSLDLTKVRQNRKRLLPILITGSREPLSVAVSRSLLKALEETFDGPPSRGHSGGRRSQLQLIETLRSALTSSKPQIADDEALTYAEHANIEVGDTVPLTPADWARIFQIIDTSRQVDDQVYARYKDFLAQNLQPSTPPAPPDLLPPRKIFTIASLPATETPSRLAAFYFDPAPGKVTPEEVRRAMHDLVTFDMPQHLNRSDFDRRLGHAFRKTPFVSDFVELLKQQQSLRFGTVNNWIHQKCEDVPLPYRWEIKENTRILYDWLAHYFPEISWGRPNYSQVIYWQHAVS